MQVNYITLNEKNMNVFFFSFDHFEMKFKYFRYLDKIVNWSHFNYFNSKIFSSLHET